MSIIYTLSTLREYTWNGFICPDKKPFSLSYLAVSKEQAYNGLLTLLHQIERVKKQVKDTSEKITELEDVILANLYGNPNVFEFTIITPVLSSEFENMTLLQLIMNTEPTIRKFYPGSIRI
jgi:hypothetical protein